MAGIYIHIPFCKSRCNYCDFFSTTLIQKQHTYTNALITEWYDRKKEVNEPINTIYIGGGTPSTLSIDNLQKLLDNLNIDSKHQEITLEANPGDITMEKVRTWHTLGINRLSIGIQSFDNTLLKKIGRRHTAEQARQAVAIAQSVGFNNISIDLMYALPSETMQQWQADVVEALHLGVQHISTYGLIYEEGTHLTAMLDAGNISKLDEDTEIQMYDYLVEQLTTNGFVHYEVSNFARKGYESKHNSSYWNNIPYLGLGASAHSYDGQKRQWNISDLDSYIQQAITHTLQPEIEVLTDEERHTELVMLGLRTNRGVAIKEIKEINIEKASYFIQNGLLIQEGNHIKATTKGFHILNKIIEQLI